jgi:putative ABC transport system ATP-binding protein
LTYARCGLKIVRIVRHNVTRLSPSPSPSPSLVCRGLQRCFGQGEAAIHALAGVDFSVSAGELVAIVGPSGSGKSTLLHLLGGLDRPDAGQVLLEGADITQLRNRELARIRRRRLGFLLQFYSLLPSLTALENVAFPLLLDGVRNARIRATAALSDVGMEGRASHKPAELSGGEQQRVALARAIVVDPAIVLADEPTGSLDMANSQMIFELMREVALRGCSVVLASHDRMVSDYADRLIHLEDGRIQPASAVTG